MSTYAYLPEPKAPGHRQRQPARQHALIHQLAPKGILCSARQLRQHLPREPTAEEGLACSICC